MFTDDDMDQVYYFFFEKGDIRRWCDWEEKKHLLKEKDPILFNAIETMYNSEALVSRLLKARS